MCILLSALLLAHDIPPRDEANSAMQHAFLSHFFRVPDGDSSQKYVDLLEDLLPERKSATLKDECSWNGVMCTGRTATSIILQSFHHPIDMDWVPSTVQRIFIQAVPMFNSWLPERLPRELRFFYNAVYIDGRVNKSSQEREVDLTKLPCKMEELIIHGGWFLGDLYIVDLPPSMRILVMQNKRITHAQVHFESLPESLVQMCFSSTEREVLIEGLGEKKADHRVRNNLSIWDTFRESKYCAKAEI